MRTAPKIDGSLGVHYVKRSFNTDGVCFLEFHRLSNDPEAFHVQYYPQSNILLCDHNGNSQVNNKESNFCKIDFKEGKT